MGPAVHLCAYVDVESKERGQKGKEGLLRAQVLACSNHPVLKMTRRRTHNSTARKKMGVSKTVRHGVEQEWQFKCKSYRNP